MVLPGIQALFGFQFIAVFNSGFTLLLSDFNQKLHLSALILTTFSIAFVMTPAAYHRQTGSHKVKEEFLKIASKLLLFGMLPLMMAFCIDVYLIAQIIISNSIALLLASLLTILFIFLWYTLSHSR
ncbi:hypothetical protein SAMN05421510_10963 [Nitrosomonas ureae]|uniref:Uncharacterized protein n=2 Tax=Nitrosomonas ureae TaxID=44577 RepID=A0A1H9HA94_9PROT|nr:hypothetical protein SAMN05421510_10963 [Nitrosomonas ureae]